MVKGCDLLTSVLMVHYKLNISSGFLSFRFPILGEAALLTVSYRDRDFVDVFRTISAPKYKNVDPYVVSLR